MRDEAKIAAVWICTCAALVMPWLAASAHGGSRSGALQEPGLRIVVIEGEDSVNIIGQGTAVPTVVEVLDRNDLPAARASVLFLLLGEQGNASLNEGLSQVTVATNASGQAEVTVNPVASGTVELSVTATFQGLTASTTILQTNVAAAGGAAGTGPDIGVIAGIAAGAAAVGLGVRQVLAASPPSTPTAPTLTPGDRRLDVSWTPPSDNGARIDDYDVRYRSFGGGWTELSDDGGNTNTRATIGGLTNGTTYEVQVRAQNSKGESPWSAGATGTPIGAPSTPAAPTLTPGNRRLEVSWTAPSDNGARIHDYDVRYRSLPGGVWTELSDNGLYAGTRATIGGLTSGTTYAVQVRAQNSVGESPWSAAARGTPIGRPSRPAAPTLTAGDGQLEVDWTPPSDSGAPISDYDVRYRSSGGTWAELSDNGRYTNTRATIRGLTNGTTYQVQVRAENSAGDGPWSPSSRGTPMTAATAPDAPAAPTLTPGDGQLAVSWTAPSDNGAPIEDYDVRYRSGGGWTELSDDGRNTNASATIGGLTNGTTYEVQVRAENSAGDGPWSPSSRGTPMAAATAPDAPAAPTLTPGDGQLAVSWTAPSNNGAPIEDYDVRYRSGGGWTELSDERPYTDTRLTIGGLTNGTTYEVQVRAENSAGDGPWSPSSRGTPTAGATAPDAPTAPTLTPGDGQLAVSWTAPSNNGAPIYDYDVRYRSGGGWRELSDDGRYTDTRLTIRDLTNGTTYEVQVRAENSAGDGPWSPTSQGTPMAGATAPDAPAAPTLTPGDGQLEVSWTAPPNNGSPIYDYDVRYRSGGDWRELSDDGRYTDTRLTIRNLTNGTAYEVQVRAGNAVGYGAWSPSSRGTPAAAESPDRAVLMVLYNATDGPRWTISTNWGSSLPIGEWHGVDANQDGRVTSLTLADNALAGSIPSSLGDLTDLRRLYLYANRLTGAVPSSLGNLTNLEHLFLDANELSERIPPTLGRLANLTAVGLSRNGLVGQIPASLGNLPNLAQLDLHHNRLTGSIPAALCQFEDTINPQLNRANSEVNLLCEGALTSANARLSVADAAAAENSDGTIDFLVTLDQAASGTVSVDYATVDGSARAGADYAATSGTLTFLPGERSKTVRVTILDDVHDEAAETFTLALSNASGGTIVDGEAIGRIENHDPLPRALVARFGRAAATHVVDQVEERLQAPREPGFEGRLAGRELGRGAERDLAQSLLGQLGGRAAAQRVAVGDRDPLSGQLGAARFEMGVDPLGSTSLPGAGFPRMGLGNGMLSGSAFAFNRETRRGGVLSLWSRSAQSSFAGREGAVGLGGDVRTTMFGADYAKGPLVVGLSLANSRGLGEYAGAGAGRVTSSVTGLYPWLGYRATDRVTVWGVAGYGAGGMLLTPGDQPGLESGLSMAMTAGGMRGELLAADTGGFGLAYKADALWVGTRVAGAEGSAGRLAATEAAVTRFRTGLEGAREFAVSRRISLRPSAEVGLRHDGGDAEAGAGMDVGAGLIVSDASTGLAVDVRVRMLVVHQAEGFRERGMAVSLSWDPTPSTPLGFTARVAPSWGGEATSGAEALWGRETMAGLATGSFGSGNRLDTEVGYGLPVGSRFVGTPRVGFAASEYGRDYWMGYGLAVLAGGALNLELGVDARRRESPVQGGADTGFLGRATLGW